MPAIFMYDLSLNDMICARKHIIYPSFYLNPQDSSIFYKEMKLYTSLLHY